MKNILVFIFTLSSILSFGQNSQEDKTNNPSNKDITQGKRNFSLTGRHAAFIPTIDNDCNSFGKVVLEITVDKSGKTISAVNTENSTADICLIKLAIKFALNTKWKPSETAPEKQVGTITYNFTN